MLLKLSSMLHVKYQDMDKNILVIFYMSFQIFLN